MAHYWRSRLKAPVTLNVSPRTDQTVSFILCVCTCFQQFLKTQMISRFTNQKVCKLCVYNRPGLWTPIPTAWLAPFSWPRDCCPLLLRELISLCMCCLVIRSLGITAMYLCAMCIQCSFTELDMCKTVSRNEKHLFSI